MKQFALSCCSIRSDGKQTNPPFYGNISRTHRLGKNRCARMEMMQDDSILLFGDLM